MLNGKAAPMPLGNHRHIKADIDEAGHTSTPRVVGSLWRAVPVALGLLTVSVLILAGCQDEIKRYETLSFFFDGVPPPEGHDLPEQHQPLIGPWGITVDRESELGQQMLAKRQAAPNARSTAVVDEIFYYHTPYKKRDCFGCHDQEKGYTPPATGAQLCSKCHESYVQHEVDDWVHGPVVVGQCGWCHEAHKAEHPALAKDLQPALCMTCHDESFIEQDTFHAGLDNRQCSDCHDPHASGNRMLLADSRTYDRRSETMALLPSPHAGWPKDLCSKCHVPEQSNALTDDVDSTCISCHDDYNTVPAGSHNLHEAVTQGKCSTCHMPHRATLPILIRADAELMCYQCHKPEEVRTGNHPDVARVDCLICHTGHSSSRPALLKHGIKIPARQAEPGGEL